VLKLADKVKIIEKKEQGVETKKLCEEFKTTRQGVHMICKDKEKIRAAYQRNTIFKKRKIKYVTVKTKDVDESVLIWFIQERKANRIMTHDFIQAKTEQFSRLLYDLSKPLPQSWHVGFCQRFGLKSLAISGNKATANVEAVIPFKQQLAAIIEEFGLSLDDLYNADEFGYQYLNLPKRTMAAECETEASGGVKFSQKVTVLPCCNASGIKLS
jgi:hypothetical protein